MGHNSVCNHFWVLSPISQHHPMRIAYAEVVHCSSGPLIHSGMEEFVHVLVRTKDEEQTADSVDWMEVYDILKQPE